MQQSICDLRADLAEVHAGPGQRPKFPPFPLHSYLDVDAGWIPLRTPPPNTQAQASAWAFVLRVGRSAIVKEL